MCAHRVSNAFNDATAAARATEALRFDYVRQHRLDIRMAQTFNKYGLDMNPRNGRVVGLSLMRASHGEPVAINGDGAQMRSFRYVDDSIDVTIAMREGPVLDGPVNMGNSDEFNVTELAAQVPQTTKSCSQARYLPVPKDDPTLRRPDITRVKTLYGWQPRVGLTHRFYNSLTYLRESASLTGAPHYVLCPSEGAQT